MKKKCVLIGGGDVALRKVETLLDCGGDVHVVSPKVVRGIEAYAGQQRISLALRCYRPGDLEGAFLAFAATDCRATQNAVAEEALQRGILLNSIDDPEACDFHVPASVRRGDMLITVSTGGASPALAARVRHELEVAFGPEYVYLVRLLGSIRRWGRSAGSSGSRRALYEKLLQNDVLQLIRNDDRAGLEERLRDLLPRDIRVDQVMAELFPVEPENSLPRE